jgi:hypothetical protein
MSSANDLPPIPTEIQNLLRLAAVDAALCDELVERRGDVAVIVGDTGGVSQALPR